MDKISRRNFLQAAAAMGLTPSFPLIQNLPTPRPLYIGFLEYNSWMTLDLIKMMEEMLQKGDLKEVVTILCVNSDFANGSEHNFIRNLDADFADGLPPDPRLLLSNLMQDPAYLRQVAEYASAHPSPFLGHMKDDPQKVHGHIERIFATPEFANMEKPGWPGNPISRLQDIFRANFRRFENFDWDAFFEKKPPSWGGNFVQFFGNSVGPDFVDISKRILARLERDKEPTPEAARLTEQPIELKPDTPKQLSVPSSTPDTNVPC